MKPPNSLALALAVLGAGCATAPPPTSQRVVAHSAAADAGGTLVIVDVCVNYSPLVTTDYFVVGNARQGAAAMEAVVRQFLDAADLRSRTVLIPFVCGALHGATNVPKRVADEVDGNVAERPQPLWLAPEVAADADYVNALQTLATHVFRRSIAAYDKDKPPPEGTDTAAEDERARQAAVLAAQRSGRSSLLYVGVTGHSNSSGKSAAAGLAIVIGSVATTLAIGPVFTAAGASYHVVFVPGGPVDKRQMAAGIYDLKQGRLVSSRVVGAPGDPMKPEVLAERNGLNLLLREMLLTPAP
jgi:hypothetical protein